MKTLCFKFHQNRAINKKIYFWGDKFLSGGPSLPHNPPPLLSKNIKLLIYGAILLKFETELCLCLPIIIEIEIHIWGFPLSLQKSNYSYMVRFCWKLKRNISICLPIIIEIRINKWGPLTPPPPYVKKVKFLIFGVVLLKFGRHFHVYQ